DHTLSFHHTAPTAISTLSLHDALPISGHPPTTGRSPRRQVAVPHAHAAGDRRRRGIRTSTLPRLAKLSCRGACPAYPACQSRVRSEEHTSELQSRENLVCRLLLEKKKK